jgi:acetolactate synthase-1/2/3 large subunit
MVVPSQRGSVARPLPSSIPGETDADPQGDRRSAVVRVFPPAAEAPLTASTAHAILDILEREGVRYIFGVPGGPLTGLFEAMHERKSIRLVLAKHEGGAAFMAAAHARVSGRLAVCCATSGPGATNALTGIASAFTESLPVLLLTGQVATSAFGKGAVQESSAFGVDIVSIFRPVTKMSVMLPSVARGPDTIRAAIRAAVSGRPGPVHVNLPADYIGQPVTYAPLRPAEYGATRSRAVDPESIQKAADLLAKAERPCILAGHGVALSDAAGPLYDLACALQAPVATSPKGKGVFPEDHELSLGVLGFGGQARAEAHIESEIDALLLVGTSMNEFVTNGWVIRPRPETPILQIDVDPLAIGRNYPVAVAVVGDARASLSDLVDRIPRRKPQPAGRAGVSPGSELLRAPSGDDDGRPISPARLVLDLREAIPEDALFFVDTGNSILWATHHFEVRRANTYFIDLGFGAMGSAIAGVVGGAMAAPGRHCIALVGDAAFAMHGFEIHTAVEERRSRHGSSRRQAAQGQRPRRIALSQPARPRGAGSIPRRRRDASRNTRRVSKGSRRGASLRPAARDRRRCRSGPDTADDRAPRPDADSLLRAARPAAAGQRRIAGRGEELTRVTPRRRPSAA